MIYTMKKTSVFIASLVLSLCFSKVFAQEGDPKLTEVWEPIPKVITPATESTAPSDAIVLFDGKGLGEWESVKGGEAKWEVKKNAMTVVKGTGDIRSKKSFGDIQLHIEWRSPEKVESEGQGRANSGVFFQERYEIQILDSYNNRTYSNGQAGCVYKQTPPLVNACRKPGEWQTYDILFTAPRFKADGSIDKPAYITVIHNGVVIQNHTEIKGTTEYIGAPKWIAHDKAPIKLQDHGNPVSYRNVWVREL
jgi:Domain of Unknown Function (DUF1080)